jgi:hypothetical protein
MRVEGALPFSRLNNVGTRFPAAILEGKPTARATGYFSRHTEPRQQQILRDIGDGTAAVARNN